MEQRRLGRTGVSVSKLCLGAMMFGDWGTKDHQESIRIIHRALEAGVNFIDTADVAVAKPHRHGNHLLTSPDSRSRDCVMSPRAASACRPRPGVGYDNTGNCAKSFARSSPTHYARSINCATRTLYPIAHTRQGLAGDPP